MHKDVYQTKLLHLQHLNFLYIKVYTNRKLKNNEKINIISTIELAFQTFN